LLRRVNPAWVARVSAVAGRYRRAALVAAHLLAFVGTYELAYLVRFDGVVPPAMGRLALLTLPAVLAVKLASFLATDSLRGWSRFTTLRDLVRLAEAVTLGSVVLLFLNYCCREVLFVPRSVLLLDWAGTLLVLGGIRSAPRLLREHYYPLLAGRPRRVLVVGSTEASVALVREIDSRPQLGLKVVGILDVDPLAWGRPLAGVKVLGHPRDLERWAPHCRPNLVLLSAPSVPPREIRHLVTACNALNVKVQVVAGLDALLTGAVTFAPRDVRIEDLLGRQTVQLDLPAVGRFLRGRVVLVTGAAGSIGSEICRQVLAFAPAQLVLLDHSENGLFYVERELRPRAGGAGLVPCVGCVTDGSGIRALLGRYQPEVVFHAAAHKHVPLMEANPGEAVKNNVFGTRTLLDEVVRAGAKAFVMISTDKAVRPTSVMGACKRLAEMYAQSLSGRTPTMYAQSLSGRTPTRMVTVRFGNVLGSSGSVVRIFKEQIRNGGPVTVTDPAMTRYFMTIPEAAQLVLEAGAMGQTGAVCVLDMGEPVKVVDLARDMIRLSGLAEGRDIEIVFTGLRPGEKLYEELYHADAEYLPTPHPKIFTVQAPPCSHAKLRAQLQQLARVVERPAEEVIAALRRIVPDYRPNRPLQAEPPDEAAPQRPGECVIVTAPPPLL
jgi:FlaA1/EpsC-like NDP-sugar epimerase